ncbi:MAG: AAA-associated domain-containing protein [Candidatus Caldarchaeum sp.]|nr:AAA-associated domain-containing protein [Candidatus Caldarchaeum sp.]MCX8202163.1 AAA-associated domain-containing protein [Candidatus Caldarchaeum sp.]MDW8062575.1 AAA-associated domain-containing protein [Candidatus Caldarchaeum sp.]MDW8435543.1 AAA-associated domain-containing protein [Candidatus Caldarchaeum sp.]
MGQHLRKFPLDARLGTVLGLLELVVAYGGKADIAFIARELQMEVDHILPASTAAELLGVLEIHDGEGIATALGIKVSKSLAKGKKKILREQLPSLEPFATALVLARDNPKGFSLEDLLNRLSANPDLVEYSENGEKLRELLMDWMIYTELLSYDGNTGLFKLKARKSVNSSA